MLNKESNLLTRINLDRLLIADWEPGPELSLSLHESWHVFGLVARCVAALAAVAPAAAHGAPVAVAISLVASPVVAVRAGPVILVGWRPAVAGLEVVWGTALITRLAAGVPVVPLGP